MNFGFFNEIPNYFGQTIDLVKTVPFDFQQLPKYTPIIPPPNIINETPKVQRFDTGNFQDFEFRAPLQSVLIPPTVAPPIIESVIPTPPIVEQVIPPIVQSAQPVPPAWQPFYVPQIIQQIPQPSAPTVIQIIQQPVQPAQNFDKQFSELFIQNANTLATVTQQNKAITQGLQDRIETLARDNATNITNFNNTEKASAQTISTLTSNLANTNNTVTQQNNEFKKKFDMQSLNIMAAKHDTELLRIDNVNLQTRIKDMAIIPQVVFSQPTGPFVGPVREQGNNALSGLFMIRPVVFVLLLAMK